MSDGSNPIEQACSILISNTRSKFGKNKDLVAAVEHACHILRTLVQKRVSLSYAVTALDGLSQECQEVIEFHSRKLESYSLNDEIASVYSFIQQVLVHWFIQYIRIRDGLVIITSGECRHPADQILAEKGKSFASNLSKKCERSDGTRVYREEGCYSGYAWDEFHDEEVGVRARMIQALGGISSSSAERKIDRLLDGNSSTFEIHMSEHENSAKSLEKRVESVKDDFVHIVNRYLKRAGLGTLSLKAVDKFEKLLLNKQGQRIFVIDRMADNFVIRDKGGVIPSVAQLKDWQRAIELPEVFKVRARGATINKDCEEINTTSNLPTKQRRLKNRAIQDDDDDNESVELSNCNTISKFCSKQSQISAKGLKVKTSSFKQVISGSPTYQNISLTTIKDGLGINSLALQASMEQAQTEDIAAVALCESNANEIMDDIAHHKEEIRRCKKELKTASDNNEIWNLKEGLREVSMKLGNMLLSLASTNRFESRSKVIDNAEDHIREALKYFMYANVVIESLNDSYLRSQEKDVSIEKILLLLRTRARLNAGIASVELYGSMTARASNLSPAHGKITNDAEEQLKHAEEAAVSLKKQLSVSSFGQSFSFLEKDKHAEICIYAQAMTVLASIEHARVKLLCFQQNWQKSTTQVKDMCQFEKDCPFSPDSYYVGIMNISKVFMDDLHKEVLEYLIVKYMMPISLLTMAASILENKASDDDTKTFFEASCIGYQTALRIRNDIEHVLQHHKSYDPSTDSDIVSSFLKENEICNQSELESGRSELQKWWNDRNQPMKTSSSGSSKDYPIPFLYSSDYPNTPSFPATFSSISDRMKSSPPTSTRSTMSGNMPITLLKIYKNQNGQVTNVSSKRKYRRWGDERLLHPVGFPAGPPSMVR